MNGKMVKVLYFGIAQEIAGSAGEEFAAENTALLRKMIAEKYPRMSSVSFRLALNGRLLTAEASLEENDKIAVLPPFAGG
jgi:molybdopterin synthase sulfur carrier subunit